MKPHFLLKNSANPEAFADAFKSFWSSTFPEPIEKGEMRPSLCRISACTKSTAPAAPKPPKKRYLEENYSQNSHVQDKLKRDSPTSLPMNGMSIKSVDPNDLIEMNENVVPGGGKNEGSRDSWRKRLLCWEQLPEDESLVSPKEVNTTSNSQTLVDKKVTSSDNLGRRRGSARACKGQKYREFMWTNIMHHRRKSSRWELCQDASASNNRNSETSTANSTKTLEGSLNEGAVTARKGATLGVDSYYKKKRTTRRSLGKVVSKKAEEKDDSNNVSDNDSNKSITSSIILDNAESGNDDVRKDGVVGSKKRKLRKQSIRRLEPGTSFKDTNVVEESDLDDVATAAVKKKKLRSSSDQ